MSLPDFASNNPYSDSFSPWRTAISRVRMLWALDPVKYWSAAPQQSGGTTRRSTWSPLVVRMDVLVSPRAITLSTYDRPVKASMIGSGSAEAARMSMSPMVSAIRRSAPADARRDLGSQLLERADRPFVEVLLDLLRDRLADVRDALQAFPVERGDVRMVAADRPGGLLIGPHSEGVPAGDRKEVRVFLKED